MITRFVKAKILVFAVFFVGIASGFLIANFYEDRVAQMRRENDREERRQRAERNVNQFHDYLGLSEQQRQDVTKIMEEMRAEMDKLHSETRPKFRAIEDASRNRVRALLSDEQRAKYDEFLAARRNRGGRGDRDGRDRGRGGFRNGDRNPQK